MDVVTLFSSLFIGNMYILGISLKKCLMRVSISHFPRASHEMLVSWHLSSVLACIETLANDLDTYHYLIHPKRLRYTDRNVRNSAAHHRRYRLPRRKFAFSSVLKTPAPTANNWRLRDMPCHQCDLTTLTLLAAYLGRLVSMVFFHQNSEELPVSLWWRRIDWLPWFATCRSTYFSKQSIIQTATM